MKKQLDSYSKSPEQISKQSLVQSMQLYSHRAPARTEKKSPQGQFDDTAQILSVFQKRRYQVEEIIKFHILNQSNDELNAEKVLRDDLQNDIKNLLHRYPYSQQQSPEKQEQQISTLDNQLLIDIQTLIQDTQKAISNLGFSNQSIQNLLFRLEEQILQQISKFLKKSEQSKPQTGIFKEFEEQKQNQSIQKENQNLRNSISKLQQQLQDASISIQEKEKENSIKKLQNFQGQGANEHFQEIIQKYQVENKKLNQELNEIKKLYELKLSFCDELMQKLQQPPDMSPRIPQFSPEQSYRFQQKYESSYNDNALTPEQLQNSRKVERSLESQSHQSLGISSHREIGSKSEQKRQEQQQQSQGFQQQEHSQSIKTEKNTKGVASLAYSDIINLKSQQELEMKASQNIIKVQKMQQVNKQQQNQINQLKQQIEKLEEEKKIREQLFKEKIAQLIQTNPEHQNQKLEQKLLSIIKENESLQQQLMDYKKRLAQQPQLIQQVEENQPLTLSQIKETKQQLTKQNLQIDENVLKWQEKHTRLTLQFQVNKFVQG